MRQMVRNGQADIVKALTDTPPGATVQVLLRLERPPEAGGAATLDPKQFGSSREYRMALIRRQKARTQPGKLSLVEKASSLGLQADMLSSLNAVMVQGPAHSVLDLLDQVDVSSASFEAVGV